MNKSDFLIRLNEQVNNIEETIKTEQLEMFYEYKKILLEWNENVNLTAITNDSEIINKHFIDSIIANKYILGDDKKIIDIGTGAGFPGIPLKIINDKLDVTLLDSLNKRVVFLNAVIDTLNLNNIKAIHGRAEEVLKNKEHREKYDIAISRAVAPLNVLVEYMMPAIKMNGICICLKGSKAKEELEESKNAIRILGGKVESINNVIIPNTDIQRNIIIIRKEKNTPARYPRKAGTPSKQPLS